MRFFSRIVTVVLIVSMAFCIMSCNKTVSDGANGNSENCMTFLGDYDYYDTPVAYVYEQVEGEEEGFYGIQYRKVTDLGGLSTQNDIAVCLFFYSSMSNQASSIVAGVEDLAQTLTGKVLFVAIDVSDNEDISSAYGVEYCPEFILINNSTRISTFDSTSRDYWTINDVEQWIIDNGFVPDYSLLG